MRIVSLLPSTTEIVCALGMESGLVGRSHECDYPASVQGLPACTSPKYQTGGASYEIDQRVKALIQEGLSVYRVDAELLAALDPDVILTQDHCEVCAASYSDVKKAVGHYFGDSVEIISVSPVDLDGVFLSIEEIAEAVHAERQGAELLKKMIDKLNSLQAKTSKLPAPEIVCIEWLNPLMTAGNWFPELAGMAGGEALLAQAGRHSPSIEWENVLQLDPDLLLIAPCGYGIEQTMQETEELTRKTGWDQLKAVQNKRVFIMDGNRYFNRPGPGLIDSAEILAEIFHPGIFDPKYYRTGWINMDEA